MRYKNLFGERENELVSTRLTLREIEQIDKLIERGYFLNRADFVRSSIREKLSEMQILSVRDVDIKEAKKEILSYLKKNPVAYPSDIAMELGLDLHVVMESVRELWESRKIEEAIR